MPYILPAMLAVVGIGGWIFTRNKAQAAPPAAWAPQTPPGYQQVPKVNPYAEHSYLNRPKAPGTYEPLPPDLMRVPIGQLNMLLGSAELTEKDVVKATLIRAEMHRRDPRVNLVPQIS
jgi:hypothetical protein